MAHRLALLTSAALAFRSVLAQQPGDVAENHPELTTYKCTTDEGCVAQKTFLVSDWNAHRLEQSNGSTCSVGSAVCSDDASCNENCVVQGVNYTNAGVRTSGDAVTLNQYTPNGNGGYNHASPRVYLLDAEGKDYERVQLTGQELTFDVELSTTPCGMNGALYLSEMDLTGGRSDTNPGAPYGSGYCDAQCPVLPWFNGTVNTGRLGVCCNEMDIWEANARATGFTPHPCDLETIGGCTGEDCEFEGICDKWGCGFNPYALGRQQYYGEGPEFVIDTTKKFTVLVRPFIPPVEHARVDTDPLSRPNSSPMMAPRPATSLTFAALTCRTVKRSQTPSPLTPPAGLASTPSRMSTVTPRVLRANALVVSQ